MSSRDVSIVSFEILQYLRGRTEVAKPEPKASLPATSATETTMIVSVLFLISLNVFGLTTENPVCCLEGIFQDGEVSAGKDEGNG